MKESRLGSWQEFIAYETSRETMKLSQTLQIMMDHCEYVLHGDFDKNMKNNKAKKRKQELRQEYREALKALDRDEKLRYYLLFMKYITLQISGKTDEGPKAVKGIFSSDVYSRSFNLKIWKHKQMRLDRDKAMIYAEKDNKIKTYHLENYLLRKSKSKEYFCFVLQAINSNPHEKSRIVHLGFKEEAKFNEWYEELNAIYKILTWKFIARELQSISSNKGESSEKPSMIVTNPHPEKMDEESESSVSKSDLYDSSLRSDLNPSSSKLESSPSVEEQFFSGSSSEDEPPTSSPCSSPSPPSSPLGFLPVDGDSNAKGAANRRTLTEALCEGDLDLETVQALDLEVETQSPEIHEKIEDIFGRLLPGYKLEALSDEGGFGTLWEDGGMKIMGGMGKIKVFIEFKVPRMRRNVLNALTEIQTLKHLNPEIDELDLKTLLRSENSGLFHLKLRPYNKLYRSRDFVYLKHVFYVNGVTYVVDKSVENLMCPPFTTIVRGELCIVWGLFGSNRSINKIVAEVDIKNEGYLNETQNINLILKYLKPFSKMEAVLDEKNDFLKEIRLFDDEWDVTGSTEAEQISLITEEKVSTPTTEGVSETPFKKQKSDLQPLPTPDPHSNDSSPQKLSEPSSTSSPQPQPPEKPEISPEELQAEGQAQGEDRIVRQFMANGRVKIDGGFVGRKAPLEPQGKGEVVLQKEVKGHPIWKGEWVRDEKSGPIVFVDKKKIEDQKGVLKFILSKIGKNIMSGKSILNISLPVDIFCAESNLERFLYTFTYAPLLIEPVCKSPPLERLKSSTCLGISTSVLYLNMEKPFNPILGETFQCYIDGCPGYAEQISHHPPVAGVLFVGRGYTITTQLESKVELHMNSGCGTNEGIYRIIFDDGLEVDFTTPGGEVSGLVYGDRKFNLVGKAFYWIKSEQLFLELTFNPAKKGFFSVGKQEQPVDYFEGYICKVKKEFIDNFEKKRKSPTEKEIIDKIGKVHGIWNVEINFEEETLLSFEKTYPIQLEYEPHPLPSDSNWREDIAYRRILEITKAQAEKERMEIEQRKDRKLREANPNHSAHKK